IQGKTHGIPPGWRERSGSADQAAEQPETEQQPDDTTDQTFLDKRAEAQIDEEQTQNHKGDAEQAAVHPQRPGKTIDERAAGAAEQVEQPGQGIHDQPDQGAEGLTEPLEGVGIYMHRSASGSGSGQGVTIAEVGGWSEGRCWLFPSLTPAPLPQRGEGSRSPLPDKHEVTRRTAFPLGPRRKGDKGGQTRSITAATPWPRPMHRLTSA